MKNGLDPSVAKDPRPWTRLPTDYNSVNALEGQAVKWTNKRFAAQKSERGRNLLKAIDS